MFSAVHSDRSGRLVVAADYAAAAWDGVTVGPLASGIPLPAGAEVGPIGDRVAIGVNRTGRTQQLGSGRLAVGAILPLGYLRIAHPAYASGAGAAPLGPHAHAAVGADQHGKLVVAAAAVDPSAADLDGRSAPELAARISAALRERPSNRALRQLARCAKEYRCRAAANAFLAKNDCALPVAAPPNVRPPDAISLNQEADAAPTEAAVFKPTPEELADTAVRHLDAGGTQVAFGRSCEGEPLLAARVLEQSIQGLRERTTGGTVHLETNGSIPTALRRICEAGLDSVAFRMASALPGTYEALHRPDGFRFTDVRASIGEATSRDVAITVALYVLPGLSDRASELDAIVALAGALPDGSTLVLRDLAADPERALALVRSAERPLGMTRVLERLRADAPHVRIAALARPLARI